MEVYNKNVPVFFLASLIHPNPNKKELYTSVKLVWHSQLENLEQDTIMVPSIEAFLCSKMTKFA